MSTAALLFTVALAAQGAPAPTPSTTDLAQAYYLFLEGRSGADDDDFAAAETRYREALALLGDSADIRVELANLYARQGQIEDAVTEARRALALDNGDRQAHRIMGLLLASELQTVDPDQVAALRTEAIDHLERALADDIDDLSADVTLVRLYLWDGRYDPAIVRLNNLLLDRPGNQQIVLLLVQAYQESGRTDDAQALIDSLRGGGASVAVLNAERLERQRQWQDAAAAWGQVVEGAPDVPRYRLRQAAALANGGDLDGARAVLAEATGLWPDDASSFYLLSQVELRGGRLEAAEDAALRIAEIDPDDARGPLALAEVRERRGNFQGIVSALKSRVDTAAEGDIESGVYARMAGILSRAYLQLGNAGLAIETLETARINVPDDLQVLFALGATYEQTQAFDRAERAFRDLVQADPAHAPGLNYLGYMLAERGRKLDEAASFITRALEIDADNPSYLDSLGWVYYKQSKFEQAVQPLERAADGAPDSSVIQDHLGDVYLKLGRYADAVAAFSRALDGDGDGIDTAAIQKKRDSARDLSGRH